MPQTKERRKIYTNICVEVPRSFLESINAIAKEKEMTRSELIRTVLASYVNKEVK